MTLKIDNASVDANAQESSDLQASSIVGGQATLIFPSNPTHWSVLLKVGELLS